MTLATHRTCSSTVEQSTADRQVPGATPGRSYFFFPRAPRRHCCRRRHRSRHCRPPIGQKPQLIVVTSCCVMTWCSGGGEKTRERRTRRPAPAHAPARARIAASSASSCDARRRRSSLSTAAAGVTVYGLWAPRGGGDGTVEATSKGARAVLSKHHPVVVDTQLNTQWCRAVAVAVAVIYRRASRAPLRPKAAVNIRGAAHPARRVGRRL